MYINYIAFFSILFLSFLILVILFFVSAFLVSFRRDLVQLIKTIPQPVQKAVESPKSRTWDQKYEEELEFVTQRMRKNAEEDL